jgi:hypothetical protein
MPTWIDVVEPQPGDLATHRSNDLDAREVSRVEATVVWIWIDRTEAGPFPANNYTYKREKE